MTLSGAERALPLALRDPSVRVREYALGMLAQWPSRAKAVERALPFCQDGEERLRERAAESLRRLLRGVEGPEREQALALPKERKWPTADLRLEAKLQLAIEAKAQGKAAELKKWAEEVLGDEHKQTFVCAPRPNAYAGASPRTTAGAASSPPLTWPGSCSREGPPRDETRLVVRWRGQSR
ncbi:hypothetical protein ACN28S_42105 [Cystobacter fuscus]